METLTHARRRRLFQLLVLPVAAGAVLAGCATLSGPRDVEIPLERLQRGLDDRFPLQQRALGVFELQLARPRLEILRDNDRLALTADVAATSPLMPQALRGSVSLSGRLAVDNVRNAVVLSDAHIERFVVDGADERTRGHVTAAANVVVEKLVRDVPVYTFRPDDLRYLGTQYVPTTIHTARNGLVVRFVPEK